MYERRLSYSCILSCIGTIDTECLGETGPGARKVRGSAFAHLILKFDTGDETWRRASGDTTGAACARQLDGVVDDGRPPCCAVHDVDDAAVCARTAH